MSTPPTSEIADQGPADWARPVYARQIEMLGVLAEAGLDLALQIKDRAVEDSEVDPTALVMAFNRASRVVRLSLMLQAQFTKALEDRDLHQGHLAQWAQRDARRDRKAQTLRIIERIAEDNDRADYEVERLSRQASERLDTDDIYRLMDRPVSELIAMICKDLGLDPDWPKLAQEAWMDQEIAAGRSIWPPPAAAANLPATPFLHPVRPSG